MKEFNAKEVKRQVVQWIRDWFEENGKGCNAVLGVSGGKDSSVVAALCVEALGKDRVIGVTMPNGVQKDISDSIRLINHLGIRYCNVNIGDTCKTLMAAVKEQLGTLEAEASEQTTINLPLGGLTVGEVVAIGLELGLPRDLVVKTPSDGLCGKSDEDNLGFTYAALDHYIRTGECDDPKVKAIIDDRHVKNLFKLKPIPFFEYK